MYWRIPSSSIFFFQVEFQKNGIMPVREIGHGFNRLADEWDDDSVQRYCTVNDVEFPKCCLLGMSELLPYSMVQSALKFVIFY